MHTEPASEAREDCLTVTHLTLAFDGKVILRDISFTVGAGERLFLVGPSGTGKSRLLRAIAHLDYHPEGEILLQGRDVGSVGAPAWRRAVAYLGDTPSHLSDSPRALFSRALAFGSQRSAGRHASPAAAAEALTSVASDLGLEPAVLDQPWHSLSAGQRQRLGLAIGIALRPEVLLLDEPTSHLDREAVQQFERLLRAPPCTVIWVSHNEAQVQRLGGRVLTLPEGTIHYQPPQ